MTTNLTPRFSTAITCCTGEKQFRDEIVVAPQPEPPLISAAEDVETAIVLEFEDGEEWPV